MSSGALCVEGNNGERSIKIGEQMSRETKTCGVKLLSRDLLLSQLQKKFHREQSLMLNFEENLIDAVNSGKFIVAATLPIALYIRII